MFVPALLGAQNKRNIEVAIASISADEVRSLVSALGHDSMAGRGTPSPGLEQAANFVAGRFYHLGLRPLGDAGSYLQRFPLVETVWDRARSRMVLGGRTLVLGESFHLLGTGGATPSRVTGEVVVLFGTPRAAVELSGLGLAGKVIVLRHSGTGERFEPALSALVSDLMSERPAAILVVGNRPPDVRERMTESLMQPRLRAGWQNRGSSGTVILDVTPAAVEPVLAAAGIDTTDFASRTSGHLIMQALPTVSFELELHRRVVRRLSAPNVVGVLEGSDPALRHEYIVISAHMDGVHARTGAIAEGDSIFNAADDNASGTAAMLELAQAFAALERRPRRSIIFLTVSGTEGGLWGSDYFVTHSPVPINQIVANINIDMVGRAGAGDTVSVIGRDHSDIRTTVDRAVAGNPGLGLTVVTDQWPEQNYYFRSDHINFARQGVPSVMFITSGPHADVHRSSDNVELVDFGFLARIARLVFVTGLDIANSDGRPRWNPESYSRIVALATGPAYESRLPA